MYLLEKRCGLDSCSWW